MNTNQSQTKEITLQEFENVLQSFHNENKNVIIQIKEPLLFTQVFQLVHCTIYDATIFLDGKNTVSAAFNIDKSKIKSITIKEIFGTVYYNLYLIDNVEISMNEIKSNPNVWVRERMNREWNNGRMWLYE